MPSSTDVRDEFVRWGGDEVPPIFVRRSPRARGARVSVSAHEGVVFVLPQDSVLDVGQLITERLDWIRKAWAVVGPEYERLNAPAAQLLPSKVRFGLTGEEWGVAYRPMTADGVKVSAAGTTLVVAGAISDSEKCVIALQGWLHASAIDRLLPLVQRQAEECGVLPVRVSVRNQRDRWGGCSAKGHVTLNRKLLFLDAELVVAVVRHELAHIRQPDHSRAFWKALEGLDARAKEHHVSLRNASVRVPPWAEWRPRAANLMCWTNDCRGIEYHHAP